VKIDQRQETGPWDAALDQLREWDPKWAETGVNMSTNPWTSGVLPRKTVELISVALNVACTNLNPDGTRRHIRAALDAGASREEILMVFKMASVMSIHSCIVGASILLEEATMGDVFPAERGDVGDKPPCYWTRAACRPPRPPAKPRPHAQCSTAKFKRGILPGPLAYVLEQILR